MSQPRVVKIVQGVHMGMGHTGIAKLLHKALGIDVRKLPPGDVVLCINRRGDKMKTLGCRGLAMGYLRMDGRDLLGYDALQWLPQTFGGSSFKYNAESQRVLGKLFPVPVAKAAA